MGKVWPWTVVPTSSGQRQIAVALGTPTQMGFISVEKKLPASVNHFALLIDPVAVGCARTTLARNLGLGGDVVPKESLCIGTYSSFGGQRAPDTSR